MAPNLPKMSYISSAVISNGRFLSAEVHYIKLKGLLLTYMCVLEPDSPYIEDSVDLRGKTNLQSIETY